MWEVAYTKPLLGQRTTASDHCSIAEEALRETIVDAMPPTFQDAIITTRKLGYRFLWIDSLCIIQDSLDDWKKESANMGYIYKASTLTIAADEAKDSYAGIFGSSNKGRVAARAVQCSVQISGYSLSSSGTLPSRLEGTIYCGVLPRTATKSSGPLSNRAWTLQETLLAPRVLRFSKEHVWWECRETQQGEILPFKRVPRSWDPIAWDKNELKHLMNASSFDLKPDKDGLWIWYHLVNDFSARSITFVEDKFPAISAAAKEIQRLLRQEYKAGMWLEDMHFGLAWSTFGPGATRAATYVAPSWSWASVNFDKAMRFGEVLYSGLYRQEMFGAAARSSQTHLANIIDVVVESVDHDPFAQVNSGSVRLKGPCLKICRCNVPPNFLHCHEESPEPDVEGVTSGAYTLVGRIHRGKGGWDRKAEKGNTRYLWNEVSTLPCTGAKGVLHEELLYLLLSHQTLGKSSDFVHALILQATHSEKGDVYQRIGLAQLVRVADEDEVLIPFGDVPLWPAADVTVV